MNNQPLSDPLGVSQSGERISQSSEKFSHSERSSVREFLQPHQGDREFVHQEGLRNGEQIVKKVETIVVETRPAFDESIFQKQKDLEFELAQALDALRKRNSELDNFRTRLQLIPALEFKIVAMENDNCSLRKELSEAMRELEILRREQGEWSTQNQLLRDEHIRELEALKLRVRELEGFASQVAISKQNVVALSNEVERLSLLLKSKDEEIVRVTESFKQFEFESQTWKSKVVEFEQFRLEFDQLQKLQTQLIRERDDLAMGIGSRDSEIARLKQEIARISSIPMETKREYDELALQHKNLLAELAIFRKDLNAREKKIEELTIIIADLRAKEPQFLESMNSITVERDSLLVKITAFQRDFEPLMKERDNLLLLLRNKDIELAELTKALHNMTPELDQAGDRIVADENELRSLRNSIASKDQEYIGFRNRIAELEAKIAELSLLRGQIEKITIERNEFVEVIKARDMQIVGFRRDIERLSNDLRIRGGELEAARKQTLDIEAIQRELKARDKTIGDLYIRLEEWKNQEKILVENLRVVCGERDSLIAELDALKSQLSKLLSERDPLLASLRNKDAQIISLNAGLNKLTAENEELRRALMELEKSRASFTGVISQRDIEIQRLKGLLDKNVLELEALRERIRFLDPENKRLRGLLNEQEQEIMALRAELGQMGDLEGKVRALLLQNDELRGQIGPIDSLKVELMEMHQLVESLVIKRDNLLALLQERENELKRLRPISSEFQSLRIRFEESRTEIERLNVLLAESMGRIKELEGLVANFQDVERNRAFLAQQNKKWAEENSILRSRVKETEESLLVITENYKQLEIRYAEIRDATDSLGIVHEKLVDACDKTEKVELSMRQTISDRSFHHMEKTDYSSHRSVRDSQGYEQPQRF